MTIICIILILKQGVLIINEVMINKKGCDCIILSRRIINLNIVKT